MTNSTQYRFDDFTFNAYKNYLVSAKQTHRFIHYKEIKNCKSPYVLWRHDVDVSVSNALKLAVIENEMDITATYFVHLHNEHYNLLDTKVIDVFKQVISLGHDIGLHFDCSFYNIGTAKELSVSLKKEKKLVDEILGTDIEVFSFHNPDEKSEEFKNYKYGGLINAYSNYLLRKAIYCSDSNGFWRHQSIIETINRAKKKNLHILTHPEWWSDKPSAPRERIQESIFSSADEKMAAYDNFLEKYKRENIRS